MRSRTMHTCNLLSAMLAAVIGTAAVTVVQAQPTYPAKPIRLVCPYPPGGASDFTARVIAPSLTEAWGQHVVVDNRGGAAGTIGHDVVARSAPDGYTLLLGTFGGMVSGPALGMKVPYDPVKDFTPIGLAVYTPWALVVNAAVPANSVKELIDLAKAKPGQLNYGSTGSGTPNHLGVVLLMALSGTNMVHVPYKSAGAATVELIAGRVQVLFSGLPQIIPHVKTGRLKALGIGHPTRMRALPNVPAIAETFPGFNNTGWYGLLGPLGTPRAIVNRVNAELNKTFGTPEMAKRLEIQGLEAATGTPEAFGEMIRNDLARWRKVIKDAGITMKSAQ